MSEWDRLVHTAGDAPLLPYYRGTFDAVFLALHPFFRLPGIHPLQCAHATQVFLRKEIPESADLLAFTEQAALESAREKKFGADDVARLALSRGEPVSWHAIVAGAKLEDHRGIDRALRTNIGGLRSEFADAEAADRLTAFCNDQAIFLPTEDNFQALMQPPLVTLFERTGLDSVILGDEFGEAAVETGIDTLRGDAGWYTPPILPNEPLRRLVAPDSSLLAVVPWDHFFTILAMTSARAEMLRVDTLFEGFWCDESTTIGWFGDPIRPLIGRGASG